MAAGQTATGYQWWFDSDTVAKRSGHIDTGRLTIAEDLTGLPYGVHHFNIRLRNSDGVWGAPYRKAFLTVDNSYGASAYEYWIDNDYDKKGSASIKTGSDTFSIDISDIPPGIHHLNLRMRTNDDTWGSIYRKTFFSAPNQTGATAYEYWIDNNYSGKTEGALTAGDNVYAVSLNGVKKGLHRFSYRMRTSGGEWGSVYSRLFYYTTANSGFDYEYWFDNDHASAVTGKTATGPVTFNIDLGDLPLKESHAFNMRVREADGEWGSIFRKLLLFYDNPKQIPLKGYRHSLNGEDLGYVALQHNPEGSYAFTVDLPDGAGFDMAKLKMRFDGDVLSVSDTVPIDYRIQMESKTGWAPATAYNFDFEVNYATEAEPMAVPSSLRFKRPLRSEFKAVKFTTDGNPVYLNIDRPATIDLYREGEKTLTLTEEDLAATTMIELAAGTYYAAIFNVVEKNVATPDTDDMVQLRLMLQKDKATKPEIAFNENTKALTIDCRDKDAIIRYTLDGSAPTHESDAYETPITLTHNIKVNAIASVEGLEDSDMATLDVTSFTTPAPDLSRTTKGFVFTNTLEDVTTWYTLDGTEPTGSESRIQFTEPFDVGSRCIVKAYSTKENFNDSQTVSFEVDPADFTLSRPLASFADGKIVITHPQEGTTASYALLTDEEIANGGEGRKGNGAMPLYIDGTDCYNLTLRAYATMEGWNDSEVTTLQHAAAPVISVEDFTVTITGSGKIRYTLDGSLPTAESPLYQEAFKIDETVKVRAANFENDLIPGLSETDITYLKCGTPALKGYDGRFVTMEATPGETIIYTLDGSNPLENGTALEGGKADMNGIMVTLRAVCVKDGFDNSEELTFTSEFYANETDLYTSAPHQAPSAFGWNSSPEDIEKLTVHGSLNDGTTSDNADYVWIMTNLTGLKHIDLKDVNDNMVPDGALNSANLLTAVMPATMTATGTDVFGADNNTLCAIVIPSNTIAPGNLLKGVKNPNLLGYFTEKRYASSLAELGNIVYGADLRSDEINLSHGYPFHAPKQFTAEKISYNREFTRKTAIDGFGAGWETMAVPFDVETIMNGETRLEPFARSDRQGNPFWHYRANGSSWEHSDRIEANVPYLTAMPNNAWYDEEYNVAGSVTFSAINAVVPATPEEDVAESFGNGNLIHINYTGAGTEENVYALNDLEETWNNVTFLPGSIFVRDTYEVAPFECHVTSAGRAKYLKIFDGSGVDAIDRPSGLQIWTEGNDICLKSGIDIHLPIYDLVGNHVRTADVRAGETTRVSGLTKGIYIAGHTKLHVK